MNIPDLLDRVTHSGGRLILDGDDLTIEAPEPLPDEMIDTIRQHKAELVGYLREEAKANTQPHSIKAFVTQCLTLDPTAKTRGAQLIMALSRWRRYVEAPDGFCIWDELHRPPELL